MPTAVDHPITSPPHAAAHRRTLAVLGVVLVCGAAFITYGADPSRSEALASVLCEFALCVLLVGAAALHNRGGELRISDPYLLLLGFGLNFLVVPSIGWLHGANYEQMWYEAGRIRTDIFIRLQWIHMIFLGGFSAVYFAMAPRRPSRLFDAGGPLPSPWPWLAFGILPLVVAVGERVLTTGSLSAVQNYGDVWYREQEVLQATHAEGGSALAATQVMGKVWFLPWQALGIGEGLLLARLVRERKRLLMLLFAAQLPLFTFLHAGGRSMIAIPFISALMIADLFAGPLRWRWLALVAAAALTFYNVFGVYRAYREHDFSQAVEMTSEQFQVAGRVESRSAEGDVTMVKEHYAVAWTDANDFARGASYFSEALLGLLPQQIVPEKVSYMNTATFLSRELLGSAAARGAGVAGSIIVDGYMIGRELGVLALAIVLGLIAGGVTLSLSRGRAAEGGRPRLWQATLLLSTPALCVVFYRNDLSAVISQTLTTVAMPAALFALFVALSPGTPWGRPVDGR